MNVIASCDQCGLVHQTRVPGDETYANVVADNLRGKPCPRCSGRLQVVATPAEPPHTPPSPSRPAFNQVVKEEESTKVAYARGRLDGWDACLAIMRAALDDATNLDAAKTLLDDAIDASVRDRSN